MSVQTAVIRQAARDGVGDQTFESPGFGTPQLAIFIPSVATDEDTPIAHDVMGMGATDGVSNFAAYATGQSAVAATNENRWMSSSKCILRLSISTGLVLVSAAFKEWSTDGVTVTYDVEGASVNAFITCILIKGLTNVSLHTLNLGNKDVESHVNTLGFEPTDLITFGAFCPVDTATTEFSWSLGFVHNGVGLTQVSMTREDKDNITATEGKAITRNDYGSCGFSRSLNDFFYVEFSDFDSLGYSAYPRDYNIGAPLFVIALKCPDGAESWCGVLTTKATTGNLAYTDPGFIPEFVMIGSSQNTVANLAMGGFPYDYLASDVGIGVFNADAQFCNMSHANPSLGFNELRISVASIEVINIDYLVSGTVIDYEYLNASLVSLDDLGFTLNFTNVPGAAVTQVFIAFGFGAGPAGSDPTNDWQSRFMDTLVQDESLMEGRAGWFYDQYTPYIMLHYGEEDTEQGAILCGGSDGKIYRMFGNSDNGVAIPCQVRTPSRDQDDPRLNKLYGDIMLDANTNGVSITATPGFDNHETLAAPVTVSSASRTQTPIPVGSAWVAARNVSLDLSWNHNGARSYLYIWEPRFTEEGAKLSAFSWETDYLSHGVEGYFFHGYLYLTHISTANLTFKILDEGGVERASVTIAHSSGAQLKTFARLPVVKGKLFKYVLSSASEFRVEGVSSELLIKQWGAPAKWHHVKLFQDVPQGGA